VKVISYFVFFILFKLLAQTSGPYYRVS